MDTHTLRNFLTRNFPRLAAPRPARRLGSAEPPPMTVYEEMWLGAVTGFVACLALAWAAGVGAAVAVAAAVLGLKSGGVIGMVLWAGSDHLPEDPVVPVPPSQRRDRPEG